MLTLLIAPDYPNKQGLIAEIVSDSLGTLPEFYNADGPIPLHIRCLAAADGVIPWSEDYETGDSYLVSVGNVDDKPTGGTFTIDVGGSISSALQYDSTAVAIETAVSTVSTAEGLGTVTVTLMEEGVYSLDWADNGAVPEVTVDVTYLRPQCEASVEVFRVGSGSQKARQVITIRRTAVASATVSTVYYPTVALTTELLAATSTQNDAYLINWGDAYAGFLKFDIAANGKAASINMSPQMTLEEIGIALSSHPEINYQTDGTADNIAVTRVDNNPHIEFIGTLSGASLAKAITNASIAADTVITTSTNHGLSVGDTVNITGSNSTPSIDGPRIVLTVPSNTTFTIDVTVTVEGTAGTSAALNGVYFNDDADIIYALGNTGTISFATQALADEFYSTDADSLDFRLHVKRLRGAASNTILSTPITLHRELINGATLSSPSGNVSAFVKKTELGTNVFTWLGTPSSANLAAALTDETGSGAAVFGTSPTFKTTVIVNNPANTFAYTITPAAIAANRVLNLPLITGTDTLATLGLAQTWTATQTFTNPVIANINPGADFSITNNSVAAFKSINSGATVNTLVLNAGKVGIGTAAPSETFEIVKSTTPRFRITNSSGSARSAFYQFCYGATPSVGWQFGADPSASGASDFVIASGDAGTYSPRIAMTTTSTTINGGIIGEVQALSGAGAVNLTSLSTDYTSTGAAQALTLANGTVGQIKTITHIVDGGSGVLTPTTKTGYTTITFTNAGDSVTLRYCTTAGWCVIGSFGVVIA